MPMCTFYTSQYMNKRKTNCLKRTLWIIHNTNGLCFNPSMDLWYTLIQEYDDHKALYFISSDSEQSLGQHILEVWYMKFNNWSKDQFLKLSSPKHTSLVTLHMFTSVIVPATHAGRPTGPFVWWRGTWRLLGMSALSLETQPISQYYAVAIRTVWSCRS